MVHTEDGLVPIEDIKLGDKVFAQDPTTGESGYFEVVYLTNHPVDEILYITIGNAITINDDGSDNLWPEVMEVTPDHPIYVEGKGWVKAEDLAEGDRLRRIDGGWARVLAIERVVLDEPVLVYNFTVKGVHTYFVLEVGVLVHNCDPVENYLRGKGFSNEGIQQAVEQVGRYNPEGHLGTFIQARHGKFNNSLNCIHCVGEFFGENIPQNMYKKSDGSFHIDSVASFFESSNRFKTVQGLDNVRSGDMIEWLGILHLKKGSPVFDSRHVGIYVGGKNHLVFSKLNYKGPHLLLPLEPMNKIYISSVPEASVGLRFWRP